MADGRWLNPHTISIKPLEPLELGDYFDSGHYRPWDCSFSPALDMTRMALTWEEVQLISDAGDEARVDELITMVRSMSVDFAL